MKMSTMKLAIIAGVAALMPGYAVLASDVVKSSDSPQQTVISSDEVHPADNTARNARDRNNATTVPTDQPNNQADIDVAAAVRSAIVGDSTLSMAAHNIKLVAANGAVVLRGPVETKAEKAKISEIVQQVTGVTSVDNQLEVKTP